MLSLSESITPRRLKKNVPPDSKRFLSSGSWHMRTSTRVAQCNTIHWLSAFTVAQGQLFSLPANNSCLLAAVSSHVIGQAFPRRVFWYSNRVRASAWVVPPPPFSPSLVYFATSGGAVRSHQGLKRAFVWLWTPGQSYLRALTPPSYTLSLSVSLYFPSSSLSFPSFFICLSFSLCLFSPSSSLLSFTQCVCSCEYGTVRTGVRFFTNGVRTCLQTEDILSVLTFAHSFIIEF